MPKFSLRTLLIVMAAACVVMGGLAGYMRYEQEKFFEECRSSLVRHGFQIDPVRELMTINGNGANKPEIGGSTAIDIVIVAREYDFKISHCRITDRAMTILRTVDGEAEKIHLENCKVVPEA